VQVKSSNKVEHEKKYSFSQDDSTGSKLNIMCVRPCLRSSFEHYDYYHHYYTIGLPPEKKRRSNGTDGARIFTRIPFCAQR